VRSETALRDDMWNELIDRDLDRLIDGKQPLNDDLALLESFVNSIGNFGAVTPSPEFIEYQAARAAETAQARHVTATEIPFSTGRRLALTLKRRVAAGATSLMMIVGMTGIAWASDSAVPGDWNYGIDRALESIGIGAGGAGERLQELATIREDGRSRGAEPASQPGQNPVTAPDDAVVGLENAAATVVEITQGSQRAGEVREGVSALLAYLANTEAADGSTISEIAQQFKQAQGPSKSQRPDVNPGEQRRPEQAGKPTG
jgi:hypothetical protein